MELLSPLSLRSRLPSAVDQMLIASSSPALASRSSSGLSAMDQTAAGACQASTGRQSGTDQRRIWRSSPAL